MSKIKAALFDFDGTCADTEVISKPITEAVLKEFLASHGESYLHHANDLEMTGKDFGQVCADLSARSGLDVPVNYLRIEKLRPAISQALLEARLAPNLENIFSSLGQNNVEIAIVTNSPRMRVEPLIKKHNMMHYIADIYSALEDTKILKPDPSVYFHACEKLGIDPSEALAIEDSVTGMRAATAAGIGLRVGYLGLTPPEDVKRKDLVVGLYEAGAHKIVYDIQDIADLLDIRQSPRRRYSPIAEIPRIGGWSSLAAPA
jgi:putative hydrolase of the HAD superfamily